MFEIYKLQFEKTKETLKDVEENIKRISGVDLDEFAIRAAGNLKLKNEGKFISQESSFQQRKRKLSNRSGKLADEGQENWDGGEEGEIVTDESDEEENQSKKPSLQSTVVATKKRAKSRKATMEEQKSDSRGLARNRRMFGFVLGTLEKFRKEETQNKAQAERRAEIDKKLEEAAAKEKEEMKKEKEQMFIVRREKRALMRCLEKKMDIAKVHEVWENSHKLLVNFIRTDAQPVLMFAPVKHNDNSKKKLKVSQDKIITIIKAQRMKIDQELSELDESYRKDNENDDKEAAEEESKSGNASPEAQFIKTETMKAADSMVSSDSRKQTLENDFIPTNDAVGSKQPGDVNKDINDSGVHEDFEPIYDDE